jgi:hypothetical protein
MRLTGRKTHRDPERPERQTSFLKHTPAGFAIMIHITTGNGEYPVIKSNSVTHRFSDYLIIRSLLMRG